MIPVLVFFYIITLIVIQYGNTIHLNISKSQGENSSHGLTYIYEVHQEILLLLQKYHVVWEARASC